MSSLHGPPRRKQAALEDAIQHRLFSDPAPQHRLFSDPAPALQAGALRRRRKQAALEDAWVVTRTLRYDFRFAPITQDATPG
ncbi:MAG: hypothetical protein ACE5OS_14330 [Anaerolineae bacterium]